MCQAPHPKCRAVASVPAPAAEPPDNDSKEDKDSDDDDNNNNVDLPSANSLVIDIDKVGIAAGERGCQCREHKVCCGKVVNVDIVFQLHHKEILVSDVFLGKDNMMKETAITVNCVTNRFKGCCVGFLPLAFILSVTNCDVSHCQVIVMFDKDESSRPNWAKWKKHNGFTHAMVISKLNGKIICKVKGMEIKEKIHPTVGELTLSFWGISPSPHYNSFSAFAHGT